MSVYIAKPLYFAFRKAPANQDGGRYTDLDDTWRFVYEWHENGSVWRALQRHSKFGFISEDTYLAPESVQWNSDEFDEKWYPHI